MTRDVLSMKMGEANARVEQTLNAIWQYCKQWRWLSSWNVKLWDYTDDEGGKLLWSIGKRLQDYSALATTLAAEREAEISSVKINWLQDFV